MRILGSAGHPTDPRSFGPLRTGKYQIRRLQDQLTHEYRLSTLKVEQRRCGVPGTFARSPAVHHEVKQHTNAGRIAPRFLEGRRSLELVEDRAPIQTAGKAE